MAVRTSRGRGCINKDFLGVNVAEQLMTAGAGNVTMLALQSELGPLIVVEQ